MGLAQRVPRVGFIGLLQPHLAQVFSKWLELVITTKVVAKTTKC